MLHGRNFPESSPLDPSTPRLAAPSLTSLGRLIFLDRYAMKDQDRSHLRVGQEVVVCPDIERGQREVAMLRQVDYQARVAVVAMDDLSLVQAPFDQIDCPVEDFDGALRRMARAVAQAEKPDLREKWEREFLALLRTLGFVPAGRVWAGAGVEEKLTAFNCNVIPAPKDSRSGIVCTLDRMTELMSRGGGVGIPLMSLRPRYNIVRGVNGRSSGSVSWGELYSFTTGKIEQGGSRRGALMLIQYAWHPDVIEFIHAKRDPTRIKNANVSVGITDAFMDAVARDIDWDLVFPDTSHPSYDSEWDGDLGAWKEKGRPVVVHKTVRARFLWNQIVESAHAAAEPGLFFVDRVNKESNSWYYARGRIYSTNPCGEQPLPPWAVCNLGHLNLPRFLDGDGMEAQPALLNKARLRQAVRSSVRFLDDVLDVAFTPYPEMDDQRFKERRIGLGTMGLAEMLTRVHIRYGNNPECLRFLDDLYGTICEEAYLASAELAVEKGSFPWFDADKLLQSGFAQKLPEHVRQAIRSKGLRNVTLITQAPTGTVGTLMGTSTGIEPWVWWEWDRKGRLGTHRERASVYEEYLERHPALAAIRADLSPEQRAKSASGLPPWFVTTADLSPGDHAYTQAAIQRWTDSSISKTSNLPADYTPAEVGDFYRLLYDLGCKGGTVYRDQSRAEQVLNLPLSAPEPAKPHPILRPVPADPYDGKAQSVDTPLGKASVKLFLHPEDGEPFEVWVDVSRSGSSVAADKEALARLSSLVLRLDSPVPARERVSLLIDQLAGIKGDDSAGFGPERVLSLPDGVAKALRKLLAALPSPQEVRAPVEPSPPAQAHPGTNGTQARQWADLCPSCHGATLLRVEGCEKCPCGYSRC